MNGKCVSHTHTRIKQVLYVPLYKSGVCVRVCVCLCMLSPAPPRGCRISRGVSHIQRCCRVLVVVYICPAVMNNNASQAGFLFLLTLANTQTVSDPLFPPYYTRPGALPPHHPPLLFACSAPLSRLLPRCPPPASVSAGGPRLYMSQYRGRTY